MWSTTYSLILFGMVGLSPLDYNTPLRTEIHIILFPLLYTQCLEQCLTHNICWMNYLGTQHLRGESLARETWESRTQQWGVSVVHPSRNSPAVSSCPHGTTVSYWRLRTEFYQPCTFFILPLPRFIEVKSTDKIVTYFKCTSSWFDVHIPFWHSYHPAQGLQHTSCLFNMCWVC